MLRRFGPAWAALLIGGFLVAPALAQGEKRTAEAILKDLEAVKMPEAPANRQDPVAVKEYNVKSAEAIKKCCELRLELYKTHPNHPDVPKLMAERWQDMSVYGRPTEGLSQEIEEVLAGSKSEKLRTEALYIKACLALRQNEDKIDPALPAINAFVAAAPKDIRAGQMLDLVAAMTEDKDKKTALEDRVVKDFPDTRFARRIAGARRQREGIGKPFDLPEFKDAISGQPFSMARLEGKVVVVDFWATWCEPCVAEMPTMKKLYAEYKSKGVEFVGVSLDQSESVGGLTALKEFVAKNEIGWPQYYEGSVWDGEFAGSWGVYDIPCVFIVDAQGKLYSTEARGKLEELIPELLKKVPGADAGGQ